MLKVREDRFGPGQRGWGRSADCGCLVTQLCLYLGLPPDFQNTDNLGFALLRDRVSAETGLDFDPAAFRFAVKEVQALNDESWSALVSSAEEAPLWFAGEDWVGQRLLNARETLGLALSALRRIGVEVEWVTGDDFAPQVQPVIEQLRTIRGEGS
jgi:hypothetical protein